MKNKLVLVLLPITVVGWTTVVILGIQLTHAKGDLLIAKIEVELHQKISQNYERLATRCVLEWRNSLRETEKIVQREILIDELARRIAEETQSQRSLTKPR